MIIAREGEEEREGDELRLSNLLRIRLLLRLSLIIDFQTLREEEEEKDTFILELSARTNGTKKMSLLTYDAIPIGMK